MRAAGLCLVALLAWSVVVFADDHSVVFDDDVDFSRFATFGMGESRMASARPELNFPAVMTAIGDAIRGALGARGLREAPDRPDLVVTYRVTSVDYNIGPAGRPNVIRPGPRGGRGGRGGAVQVDFTEATLVVDLSHGEPAALVWRGVYHDTEEAARKLAEALPKDARELLASYPPKKER